MNWRDDAARRYADPDLFARPTVGLRDIDAERPELAGFGLVVHVMTPMIS